MITFSVPFWLALLTGLLALVGYVVVGIFLWYLVQSWRYGINSGQLGHSPYLYPVECFLEELVCYLPGGKKERIAFIDDRMAGTSGGAMLGFNRSYDHEVIRRDQCQNEVFYQMSGGPVHFWFMHLKYLAWPVLPALSVIGFGISLIEIMLIGMWAKSGTKC